GVGGGGRGGGDGVGVGGLGLVDRHQLDGYAGSALAFAASARAALRHGAWSRARADLARAEELRPMLTEAMPWYAVQVRLEMTRVHLALADAQGAQSLLAEIDDLLETRSLGV